MDDSVAVSAAMIVRNEQGALPGCLESLLGRVDEVVIVDTGSTDETVEIATKADVRLLHHAWTQDFAAARNAALAAVSCDWVLYIDADERLNLPAGGTLADYIDPRAIACFVRFRPKSGYTRYREWRLFRNDPRIRFEGNIHETIVPAIRKISVQEGLPVVQTMVEINHLGYDGDQAHKHARNLALLQSAVRSNPDKVYYWYHLAETLAAIGHADQAAAAAAEGLAAAERNDTDDQRAAASLIFQLLARTQIEQNGNPFVMIDHALARVPDDYALWFLRGRALLDADRPREALDVAKKLRAIDPELLVDGLLAFDSSIFKEKACELAALACLHLGRRQDAAEYFMMASSLAPSDFAYRIKAAALSRQAASRHAGTEAWSQA